MTCKAKKVEKKERPKIMSLPLPLIVTKLAHKKLQDKMVDGGANHFPHLELISNLVILLLLFSLFTFMGYIPSQKDDKSML